MKKNQFKFNMRKVCEKKIKMENILFILQEQGNKNSTINEDTKRRRTDKASCE